jgi:hypothetical protein
MREAIVWMLVAMTLALAALFWVKPLVLPVSDAKNELIPLSKTHKWDWKAPVPPPPSTKDKAKPAPPIKSDKDFKLYDTPIPVPPPEVPSPLPPTKYEKFKREAAEWGVILGRFSPLVTTVVAVAVKRRGKKRDKHGRK